MKNIIPLVDDVYSRRRFLLESGSLAAGAVLALPSLGSAKSLLAADPATSAAKTLIDDRMMDGVKTLLADIADWIMTLDLGSGKLKNSKGFSELKWVQGNFVRVLLSGHKIFGKKAYLDECVRWCDTMVTLQQPVLTATGRQAGYWADFGAKGKLYLADAGTFATAMALTYKHVDRERQAKYLAAMERLSLFVRFGCKEDPQNQGRGAASTWIIQEGKDRGALGCGYYRGHISPAAYVISTATNGAEFHAILHSINKDAELASIAANAVRWLLAHRDSDGSIPYTIDNAPPNRDFAMQSMTYCSEGLMAAYLYLDDAELRKQIAADVGTCIEWLVRTQNGDGTWGKMRSYDQNRSPGVLSFLAWYYRTVSPDPRIAEAVRKSCQFLLDPANQKQFELKKTLQTTSFVGLSLASIVQPNVIFE